MPACFRPYLQQQEGRSQDVRLEEGRCFFCGGGGGGWADSPTLKLTKPRTVSTGVQRSAGLFQSLPPAAGREVPGCRTGRGGAWLGAGPV